MLQKYNGINWVNNCLCYNLVDCFFFITTSWYKANNAKFNDKIAGEDPGAPKNPNIGKKFIYTTIITSIIFVGIYYMVINDFLNLREHLI